MDTPKIFTFQLLNRKRLLAYDGGGESYRKKGIIGFWEVDGHGQEP